MHSFVFDYTDGIKIDNVHRDLDYEKGKEDRFLIKTYFLHKKIKRSLQTYNDQLGVTATLEELVTESDKTLITSDYCSLGCWFKPRLIRYFVPYHVEVYYNGSLYSTDTLDCKFKLVNFTLHPKDDRELYVWMNMIERFKKEMQCDISIKNDIVNSTVEFDNFVDVKFPTNEKTTQYYLDIPVGRFYQSNNETPDFHYHPDGLHNKNSLDIIHDILYHHSYIF